MPRIDETLDLLGRAKYISTIDLTKGYYQNYPSTLNQSMQKKVFVTAVGKFEYEMMPIGLVGVKGS